MTLRYLIWILTRLVPNILTVRTRLSHWLLYSCVSWTYDNNDGICYSRISSLWPVYKPFNRIVSWSARFKTGPVYVKLKSGSISRLAQSKSRPAHALGGLSPRVHGQRPFRVLERSCKTTGGMILEASQFFFKLLLALLVSHTGAPTNASADRFQYSIRAGVG